MGRLQKAYNETAKSVLGYRQRNGKTWICAKSLSKIDERRKLKKKVEETRSENNKRETESTIQ